MTNSSRIISELVSLEAWYAPLKFDFTSPFHVALAFNEARYTGASDTPVEFKVRLKRATLVVVCDERLRVPKSTKVRQYPKRQRTMKIVEQAESSASSSDEKNVKGKAAASGTKPPSIELEAGSKTNATTTEKTGGQREMQECLEQLVHLTYREVAGEHHWDCKPTHQNHLDGIGHDGLESIMEISPLVEKRLEDMSVRVFLKCVADDFEIVEISAKPSVKERIFGDDLIRRLALAREVTKYKLKEAQLEVVELEPRFQEVVLADILALPE
ncbi:MULTISPECIES: hypothetical protein [unclassified Marinovum]